MRELRQLIILVVAGSAGLLSCQKDDAGPVATGLTGTWKLVKRDCYCVRAPVPDETITFTAAQFSVYENGQLSKAGTYTNTTGAVECGSSNRVPVLQLTANQGSSHLAVVSITNKSLVLNYKADGAGCLSDYPVDTYERL
ncbi:hypothetical protein Q5H92_24320 [Hymenobacter sp. M29]|uniref:Lipocalin-like domain-containing protein n=1 Tax=Hymenobacter mellowenesis TaxID=3063995 RepID=A0ABT9AIW5_9BACT|nr:hypothetical protein [Hymenobacter sp. M29]MDO7849513.1 hypothetical protein [Hymenobacter sp. M29]